MKKITKIDQHFVEKWRLIHQDYLLPRKRNAISHLRKIFESILANLLKSLLI